jgi:hypothetical protein
LTLLVAVASSSIAAAQQPKTYWHYDSTDGDTLFSLPSGFAVDRSRGLVYVADAFAQKVFVLDGRTGRLLRVGGRKGDGPGEYRMPGAIALSPDGNLLAVHDQGRQSVELLTSTLKPVDRREVGMLSWPKGALLLDDTTVVLSGGHMPYQHQLSSMTWAGRAGVTFNGPPPPPASAPTDPALMMARTDLAGGPLAKGRDGILMAEAVNGDVWLVGRDAKTRLARGPGGVKNIVEKFLRRVTVDGRPGVSPWSRFPQAIYLEEEAPNTFLLGWSESDSTLFRFYRLKSGAAPQLIYELPERVSGVARFDDTSFILRSSPELGDYRIERREIRLPR